MKEHSIYKTSAQKITQVLYEKGWNRSELARRMGLSVQAVQQWAAGSTKPNGKNLTKLAETTGKPEHWFFIESSEEQESADKPASTNESTDLNQQQRRLIELFDQMPESEKGKMIHLFEEKVKEYDRLLNELIALKNKRV